jgi:hypothetical protein
MNREELSLYMMKLMPYKSIVNVIISALRFHAIRTDNKLDDLIIEVFESVLNKAFRIEEKQNG